MKKRDELVLRVNKMSDSKKPHGAILCHASSGGFYLIPPHLIRCRHMGCSSDLVGNVSTPRVLRRQGQLCSVTCDGDKASGGEVESRKVSFLHVEEIRYWAFSSWRMSCLGPGASSHFHPSTPEGKHVIQDSLTHEASIQGKKGQGQGRRSESNSHRRYSGS